MLLFLLACTMDAPATTASSSSPPDPRCPQTTARLAALHLGQVDAADPRLQRDDLVVVRKAAREVLHYEGGQLSAGGCWGAGLGFAPEAHKLRQGDGRTPEGWYRTSDKPWSQFYGAIAVHYPNAEDAAAAQAAGTISAETAAGIARAIQQGKKPPQATALGGEILLHGGGSGADWTLGCVAMDNADIDALRARLPHDIQTDILILP